MEQLKHGVKFLKILVSFIFFVSLSAILAGALQAEQHFFIPAISPAFLNVCYVAGLSWCLHVGASVSTFCWLMILAAALNMFMHIFGYVKYNFSFLWPDDDAWRYLGLVMLQLVPCIVSMSIGEINFLIDARFASFLPAGSFSLVRYAYRFVGIPLGVLAASFALVLLPYFSKLDHSKEKMGKYIAESMKFVIWMILPITLAMVLCSREIFETIFFSGKFVASHVLEAQANMNAFLIGLLFFSLEKVLLNVFYALQATPYAMVISLCSAGMNFYMNGMLMSAYGGMGLALATSIAAIFRVAMFIILLRYWFEIPLYGNLFVEFMKKYVMQLVLFSSVFWLLITLVKIAISMASFAAHFNIGSYHFVLDQNLFLHSFGFWVWFGPLSLIFFASLYFTRSVFGIRMSYLD